MFEPESHAAPPAQLELHPPPVVFVWLRAAAVEESVAALLQGDVAPHLSGILRVF